MMSGHGRSGDSGSNGTTAVCDAKLEINMQKTLASVVNSFIELNLHPDLSAMVLSILIDTKDAVITLYCGRTDLLLISDKFSWRNGNYFNMTGVFTLWTMINYRVTTAYISDRLFIKSLAESIKNADKCAIQSCLGGFDVLDKFKELHEKNLILPKEKAKDHSHDEHPDDAVHMSPDDAVHVTYHVGPPLEKDSVLSSKLENVSILPCVFV